MTIKITKPFAFAHHGYDVREYSPDSEEVPPDAAEWAVENGFAEAHTKPEAQPKEQPAPPARRPRKNTAEKVKE